MQPSKITAICEHCDGEGSAMIETNTVRCLRCFQQCKVSAGTTSSALPFRRASRGYCTACVICIFFQDENPDAGLGFALALDFDPEGLRLPHIQRQFERVLAVGGSELAMEEIDWDEVIRKWNIAAVVVDQPTLFADPGPEVKYGTD